MDKRESNLLLDLEGNNNNPIPNSPRGSLEEVIEEGKLRRLEELDLEVHYEMNPDVNYHYDRFNQIHIKTPEHHRRLEILFQSKIKHLEKSKNFS